MSNEKNNEDILSLIDIVEFAMIGDNTNLKKVDSLFNKKLLDLSAIKDKKTYEAYWKLDGHAFGPGELPADKWVKTDYCLLFGLPVAMYIPTAKAEKSLVEALGTQDQEYTPIGFIDMHLLSDGVYGVSGLGIAPEYQNKGLSKVMIYAGVKVSGAGKLKVPTQLSSEVAHRSWKHVNKLDVMYDNVPHSKDDTIVYLLDVPDPAEKILGDDLNGYLQKNNK